MITEKQLKDLGFTILESDFNSTTYDFPSRLNHGGYTLKVREFAIDAIHKEQVCHVIGPERGPSQEILNIAQLEYYMEKFSTKP